MSLKILEFGFVTYPVKDMERARAFYEQILGFTPSTPTEYAGKPAEWIEYELGPHTLVLGCHASQTPSTDGPSVTFEVEDFDHAIIHLKNHNVQFLIEPFQTPVCRMAYILDVDGNKILIHKRNP